MMHATLLALVLSAFAANAADNLERREWKIDDVAREALVYVPPAAKTTASPLVFAFHGHGGTMQRAASKFGYHRLWPAAIVVYMQGLNTPGALTDPEGKKPGWQKTAGDQHDRDLKFFDAVLASLTKELKVDEKRIYCTGHSNGGGFTYLLWSVRGEVFAAVAPCAAVARLEFALKPKPAFHLAGEKDPLVKFVWQKASIERLRKLNGCAEGKPWAEHCTEYPSSAGTPVVAYIHAGGHELPNDALPLIVKFFKEHAQK